MLNAFTVDVEDYFQVSGFERDIDRCDWPNYESRVSANVDRLLDLLHRHNVHGTFFILGWVAEQFPDVVTAIHQRGHEIGSHSFWHRLVYEQKPHEFREDLQRSRDVLEDITGRPVTAYRAPSFSITKRSLWALEILVEEGFTIDSSIFPVYHDRYGIPNARPDIHEITTPAGTLWEFPPAVMKFAGAKLPISGGGYFRLKPWHVTKHCLRSVNRRSQRPFVFYTHPWEIDPKQPRLRAGSRLSRVRHHVNLASTEQKLERLLGRFRFGPISQAIETHTNHTAVNSVVYATA